MRTVEIRPPSEEDASRMGEAYDEQDGSNDSESFHEASDVGSNDLETFDIYNREAEVGTELRGTELPIAPHGQMVTNLPNLVDTNVPIVQRDESVEADATWMREVAAAQHAAMLEEAETEAAAAQERMAAVNNEAHALLRANLDEYLERCGNAASFEGWIGQLHPENVDAEGWIDMRLCLEGSEHRQLWGVATSEEETLRRRTQPRAGSEPHHTVEEAAASLAGHVFNGVAAGTSIGFAAMHGAFGQSVEGLKKAKGHAVEHGHPQVHAALRVVQGSLELADLCAFGAENVAAHGLAAAGGATCGLMSRSSARAAETHQRLRATHEKFRCRTGPGEEVLRATGMVGCAA